MPSETPTPRVLLIGCGPTTLTALESLAEQTTVIGLVRNVEPIARDADMVCRRARELDVPITNGISIREIELLVDRLQPDAVVVSSYHRVLPARVVAKTRFVNVHYSLLPRYRGRANVNWAIINGEAATGISIHVLCPDLDAGNILFQESVPIGPTDTVSDLYEKLNTLQRKYLGTIVVRHLKGENGSPQVAEEATYGCTRLPRDGEIDWTQSTHRVNDLIRSQTSPFPGAFTYLAGTPIKILRAESVSDAPRYAGRIPGRIVRISKADGWVEVLTGNGVLRVHEVQTEDGSRHPAAEIVRSVKETLGLSLTDLLDRIRVLETALAELRQQHDQLFPLSVNK